MYLQSRTRRWLQALRYANTILGQGLQMMEYFAAHAHVPGARKISGRDKRVTVLLPTDQIRMTLESQPLVAGSWLSEALSEVTTALDSIDYGDGFIPSVAALSAAIEKAIPVLEERAIEPDESIDEVIADLERSLFISIVAPLTAHNPILPLVDKWTNEHQRFLQGHVRSDVGHYFDVRTLTSVDEPGPGRVHMQHLVSACDAGMTSLVAGASQQSVEHHPEIQAVVYGQWFAYAFAIWEEQFRGRLAKYWDSQTDEKIRRSDILVDYFGDIRLIRNDVVHNKGICAESANTVVLRWGFVEGQPIEISAAQMISLIDLFPYAELRTAPNPQPSAGLKSAPGRLDARLLEDVKHRARELGLSDNELSAAAYSLWLETTAAQAPS
ncbi:hypothetical protein [Mycolicibacterium sp. CR10]|uniref:hypothetical protein n=1 Tax=Mycolicibacterium sp. CR10 TaxID=2562314 RepID=UPI0010C0BD28|nr:hypothetical protein [Mycolicibacterium sp. CR10]